MRSTEIDNSAVLCFILLDPPNLRIQAELIFWLLPPYFENVRFLAAFALHILKLSRIQYLDGIEILGLLTRKQLANLFQCTF